MKKIKINDATLRDGSHAVKHQLTLEDFDIYTKHIDNVGLDIVEIGAHGNGLGASSIQMGQALCSDKDALRIARSNLTNTKLGVHLISGFCTIQRDLYPALDEGVDVFRVASMCTEADTTKRHIQFLLEEKKEVYGVLMMSHLADKNVLLEEAKKMQSYGAEAIVLMDSAGAYLPHDVKAKVSCLVDCLEIPVGFHAHNNFNLGIANALTAIESGATIIDATANGFGAGSGNTMLEVLVVILQKLGYCQNIDLYNLLDTIEIAKQNFIKVSPNISEVSLLTAMNGLFSGFSKPVLKAADQFGVNYRDIFRILGERQILGGQEDIIIEVASELQKKAVINN